MRGLFDFIDKQRGPMYNGCNFRYKIKVSLGEKGNLQLKEFQYKIRGNLHYDCI